MTKTRLKFISSRGRIGVGLVCLVAAGWFSPSGANGQAATEAPKAQDPAPSKEQILERVGTEIEYLASPELEGRGVETKGIEIAAEYIRDEFKKAGLVSGVEDGSYFQAFNVPLRNSLSTEKSKLIINGPDGKELTLEIEKDFIPLQVGGSGTASGEIVFAGYGINAEDLEFQEYEGLDVEGKIVVIMRNEPQSKDEDSKFNGAEPSPFSYVMTKATAAKLQQAAAVIFVNDVVSQPNSAEDKLDAPSVFGTRSMGIPFVQVRQSVVESFLKQSPLKSDDMELSSLAAVHEYIDENLKPVSQPIEGWSATIEAVFETQYVETSNVVGVIEGEGPLADETVVVGGHYDHLGYGGYGSRAPGRNEIHYGADDNATGTVAVLELARRMAESGKKPRRRVVFIAFSAEERGLIGSRFYVDNPLYPLKDTVAMINFDMIGRLRQDSLTLYGVTSGVEFRDMCNAAADGLELDLNIPASGFAGSDHLPFYQKQIPDIFVHTGITDVYHTPEDTFETINVPGAVKVIDFSERLLNSIVETSDRPTFASAQARPQRNQMAYLGAVPDFGSSEEGIYIRSVTDDSPAAKAGIKTGDVILEIEGKTVANRQALLEILRSNRPGSVVKVKLERDDEEVELDVTLGRSPSRRGGN